VPPSDVTSIVFFHVDRGTEHPLMELNKEAASDIDYPGIIRTTCEHALRSNPGCRVLLITDSQTDIGPVSASIVRLDVDKKLLTYSRLRAYRALLMSCVTTGPVLFLDTDVCLNRDFASLFDGSFEIGLTTRARPNQSLMPVNAGVIMCRNGSHPNAAKFMDAIIRLCDEIAVEPSAAKRYDFDARQWWADQLALAAFINWRSKAGTISEVQGIKCKLFPCDDFNYAVQTGDSPDILKSKWAIHFKGLTKSLLPLLDQRGQS
jgi:hypothetical protein